MSFFKNLLTGAEGHSCAQNAHLVELVMRDKPSIDRRIEIVQSLMNVMRRGMSYRNLQDYELTEIFNKAPRETQLNFLSIAMKEIGISWRGEQWMPVRNPNYMIMDARDVEVNAGYFRRKYGIDVGIESQPICLQEWLETGTTIRISAQ